MTPKALSVSILCIFFLMDSPLRFESVGPMDKAIQDGIGHGWIAQQLVPVRDRELACDDGGAPVVTVLHDFQQVSAIFPI